jgi:hypothetical protein
VVKVRRAAKARTVKGAARGMTEGLRIPQGMAEMVEMEASEVKEGLVDLAGREAKSSSIIKRARLLMCGSLVQRAKVETRELRAKEAPVVVGEMAAAVMAHLETLAAATQEKFLAPTDRMKLGLLASKG